MEESRRLYEDSMASNPGRTPIQSTYYIKHETERSSSKEMLILKEVPWNEQQRNICKS